jgi:CTP synthase
MNEGTPHPVVNLMEEQKNVTERWNNAFRAWKCDIKEGSLAHRIYDQSTISERHRHRYEYNSAYVDELQKQV